MVDDVGHGAQYRDPLTGSRKDSPSCGGWKGIVRNQRQGKKRYVLSLYLAI